ncbi:phage tail protein, partial [Pantoea dispersa]
NLGLSEGAPVIGSPFPWPHAKMPNELFPSMAGMVFLKSNGASFSGTLYPELAQVYPGLVLTDLRGEFIRGWDDGRGVDGGRALLSAQGHALQQHTHTVPVPLRTTDTDRGSLESTYSIDNTQTVTSSGASGSTATETRPRNVAFNYIVRAA